MIIDVTPNSVLIGGASVADEELQIDNFQLVNCIATGGVSQIWEVFDVETNERFALKMLLKEAFAKPAERLVLKTEHRIGKQFDHPNIIRIFDFKKTKKHCYYTMDFFPGPNVKNLVRGNAAHAQSHLKRLIECVTMALGQVHDKGWVHKDVKPDNIMMNRSGEIRLIDFSLAARGPSLLGKTIFRKAKVIQGTRTYIAPEIIRKEHATHLSDLYSLGVTIFEVLTGRPPFMGGTPNELLMKHIRESVPRPSTLNSNVTPDADQLVLRLMAKKPANRPQSASDFLAEFRSVKLFHEDPQELVLKQQASKAEEEQEDVLEGISSRADAERSAKGGGSKTDSGAAAKPVEKKPEPKPARKPQPKPAAPVAQQQAPPQQAPPGYPQGYPPQGAPGQMPPGQMPPGQMPPGYPPQQMPPGYPQGYPPQGAPGQIPPGQVPPGQMPPGQMPPGYPPQQMPPGYPQGQPGAVPPPQQGGVPQPPPQQPPQQKPPQQAPPQKKKEELEDDMPFADELPDIL